MQRAHPCSRDALCAQHKYHGLVGYASDFKKKFFEHKNIHRHRLSLDDTIYDFMSVSILKVASVT